MITYVLTVLVVPFFLYAARAWRHSRLIATSLLGAALVALVFVWMPEVSNRLAHLMGVGRGADLVLYLYCSISFILLLDLSMKIKAQHELITLLARELALQSASNRSGG